MTLQNSRNIILSTESLHATRLKIQKKENTDQNNQHNNLDMEYHSEIQ